MRRAADTYQGQGGEEAAGHPGGGGLQGGCDEGTLG